jgi:uncharacterized protein (DUF1778 family)
MSIETRLTIRLEESKRKALQEKARKEGKKVTDVITDFIDQYLGFKEPDKVIQLEKRLERVEQILEERLGESAA